MTSSTMADSNATALTPATIAELQSVIDLKRARYDQLCNELDALAPELRRYESALRRLTDDPPIHGHGLDGLARELSSPKTSQGGSTY